MTAGTEKYNDMQRAKRLLFAMRNGVVADALRKGGCPHSIIFGVNLPQIKEIAAELPHTAELACKLWDNNTTRESMLLAPFLFPIEEFSEDMARGWIAGISSCEVSDILCHALLRKTAYARSLALSLTESDKGIERYTGLRLLFNLLSQDPKTALEAAEKCKRNPVWPPADRLAESLAEEAGFILGNNQ